MKADGTRRHNSTASATSTATAPSHARGRPSTRSTVPSYPPVRRANQRLNAPKTPPVWASTASRRRSAHSAGVSVSATTPDRTTAITIVIANCLNISPVTPPVNATGTKTATSDSTIAIKAPATWRMARSAAIRAGTFSVAMIRSTFSITTMASSTTIPMASTRAKRVSTLIEKPMTSSPRNVPTTLTGTASIGMSVARQLCRKTNTTSATRIMASASVSTTSLFEAVTNGVVSKGTV